LNFHSKIRLQTKATKTYNDGQKIQRPLSIPIHAAVNFESESSRQLGRDFRDGSELVYQRFGHPTSKAAGEKIALLEGAETGLVFSSGMGAISTTLLALAGSAGAHVVAQREIFAQTFTFLDETLRPLGVETTFVNVLDNTELTNAIRPTTKLVYIESPSNPLLRVADIAAISAITREREVPLLIDSTFASPYLQNPIAIGASVVLHSATKFLAGHSDVMCGAAAGSHKLIQKISGMQKLLGTILDSHAAWLLLRGIKSLGVRVQRQTDSALAIGKFLKDQKAIHRVNYPYLEDSPYYRIATKQMRGGGGVVSFQFKGGYEAATRFVDALQLIPVATSLGGVESVIEIPYDLDFSEEELGAAAHKTGIAEGLIRLSVGIEDLTDLLDDICRGLRAVDVSARLR
jgi:cystathionine beta-lyase/cystathionine gamma-synthase